MDEPRSERTTLRRGRNRAAYDERMFDVLDAGLVAHVGVSTPDGPIVLPMAYGRTDEHLYLHGAAANALLRHAVDTDICVTVTLVDGLVIARSPFHNSMNYRSVVVRGRAELVEGDAKRAALRLITDHVVASWDAGRPPADAEIRKTLVIRVPLAEVSGKIRTGPPVDDPEDIGGPHWAGQVPLQSVWGEPVDAPELAPDVAPPAAVRALAGRPTP